MVSVEPTLTSLLGAMRTLDARAIEDFIGFILLGAATLGVLDIFAAGAGVDTGAFLEVFGRMICVVAALGNSAF